MITFETLFESLRKEKFNQEIQKIDPDFYNQIIKYLEEKSAILDTQKKSDSMFSSEVKKNQLQIENIKKIIKEIYEKRENKILNLALMSSRTNVKDTPKELIPEEKKIYKDFLETLNNYRSGILQNILNKSKPIIKSKKEEPKEIKSEQNKSTGNKLIRFIQPVPKFVADDLNIYGPFDQEDMSNLPKKTADLLIKRKRAEEIKIENT